MQFWLNVWERSKGTLSAQGIELLMTEDHEVASGEVEASSKPYVTPHLSQLHNDLTSLNAFWALAIDTRAKSVTEQLVGCIGVRMDQIPRGAITRFWYNHYSRLRATEFGGIIDESHVPPGTSHLAGKVAYFGDYFLLPKRHIDQFNFVMAVLAFSELKWSPDATYAFLVEKHANLGQTYRLGFSHHVRNVHRWLEKPAKRSNSDAMIYTLAEDTAYVAEQFLRDSGQMSETEEKVVPLHQKSKLRSN